VERFPAASVAEITARYAKTPASEVVKRERSIVPP
jgi:hypothetical protein